MKLNTLLNRTVFATLLLSASVSVVAAGGDRGSRALQSGWHPDANTASAPAPLPAGVDATSASAWTPPVAPAQGDVAGVAGTAVHAKTRAQVRAELLQAEEAGSIPAGSAHYPASPELMARNRVQFQQAEKWWRARGQLNASGQ